MIISKERKEKELEVVLHYVTEFMRQVIENGQAFTQNHLFLILLHFEAP